MKHRFSIYLPSKKACSDIRNVKNRYGVVVEVT